MDETHPADGTAAVTAAMWLALGLLLVPSPKHGSPSQPDALPVTLDLVAVALRTGLPLPAAMRLAVHGTDDDAARGLDRVAALLQLGAGPAEAWSAADGHPELVPVARIARRSSTSGVRLAAAFEELAVELRRDHAAAAEARAARAGVWAIAPLGLCFLPAFVCLGVVPVVVGIARTAFTGFGTP
ncbi:MAG TPA: type II secretion system F family protein [Jatrophihabitantaceae bacterium]|nr:type II secretion system F family protein [Jatrophihabitantaceae bacterium]